MEDSMHVGMDMEGQYLFVGMYDGHGGTQAAEWLQDNLHPIMSKHVTCVGPGTASSDAMRDAMGAAFADADAALLAHLETLGPEVLSDAGSTGTVAIVAPGRVHVANVGDSAAVLLRKGRPLDLTMPHRVYGAGKEVKVEKARVQATGAWVYDGRVCNILAVSRAFGDWEFKQVGGLSTLLQAGVQREYWDQSWADKNSFTSDPIIVEPAFSATDLCDDDELLVVATDGLWDVCPQADVMRFAKNKLKLGQPAKKVAEGLVATALQRKTTDNVSVVVIDLKGPDHWAESNGGGLLGGLFGRR